jgi:cell division protein FtsB
LKGLEQKETSISKRSRQKEIIKLRAEINQLETENNWKNHQIQGLDCEKMSKIHKPLAKLTKRHRDSTKINKIRTEKRDITIDTGEIFFKNHLVLF